MRDLTQEEIVKAMELGMEVGACDIDYDEQDVVIATSSTVAELFDTQGYNTSSDGKYFYNEEFQIGKGLRRGTLAVVDYGDVRAVMCTAQGVIR